VNIFTDFDTCNAFEPSIGRCVEDGVGGARSDLSPAPSVDIANGAPNGTDASNRIVLTWVDGRDGLNHEHVMFTTSTTRGASWATPTRVERSGDRGYYSAPAISPNGTDVWLVYNAFEEPFKTSGVGPANDRPLVGQVLHATVSGGAVGDFANAHRGASGDARGSSQNDLAAEFLGDYVYAAATRGYGVGVWNDVRNAADCGPVDQYRQALHDLALTTGQQTAEAEEPRGESDEGEDPAGGPVAPAVQHPDVCPANFGNSDIYGWSSLPAPIATRGAAPGRFQPSDVVRVIARRCPKGHRLDHVWRHARPATEGRQAVEGRGPPRPGPYTPLAGASRSRSGEVGWRRHMAVDLVIDLDNTPGALAQVAAAISDAGVNIAAATCLGAGERAELHILVKHAEAARHSLAISHLAVTREREVVVVDVEDRPGVLADLTRKIARAGVDLDLVYVATRNRVVFGAPDVAALRAALEGATT
jgi:hypothetical protein